MMIGDNEEDRGGDFAAVAIDEDMPSRQAGDGYSIFNPSFLINAAHLLSSRWILAA